MGVAETRKATQQLYRLIQNYQTRLGQARAFQDADLLPEVVQRTREELAERSRQSASYKAAQLLQTAREGLAFTRSQLDDVRPKVDPNNVAQLTRTQQAWQMIVEPMRAAGKSWFDIADVADEDMMLALQRFGDQRIRLDEGDNAESVISNLHTAIDRRLAEIHPDPEARQLFADAREAGDHVGLAEFLANAADSRRPEQLTGAIVGAKSAAFKRGIQLPTTPPPPAEQLDLMARNPNPSISDSAVA